MLLESALSELSIDLDHQKPSTMESGDMSYPDRVLLEMGSPNEGSFVKNKTWQDHHQEEEEEEWQGKDSAAVAAGCTVPFKWEIQPGVPKPFSGATPLTLASSSSLSHGHGCEYAENEQEIRQKEMEMEMEIEMVVDEIEEQSPVSTLDMVVSPVLSPCSSSRHASKSCTTLLWGVIPTCSLTKCFFIPSKPKTEKHGSGLDDADDDDEEEDHPQNVTHTGFNSIGFSHSNVSQNSSFHNFSHRTGFSNLNDSSFSHNNNGLKNFNHSSSDFSSFSHNNNGLKNFNHSSSDFSSFNHHKNGFNNSNHGTGFKNFNFVGGCYDGAIQVPELKNHDPASPAAAAAGVLKDRTGFSNFKSNSNSNSNSKGPRMGKQVRFIVDPDPTVVQLHKYPAEKPEGHGLQWASYGLF